MVRQRINSSLRSIHAVISSLFIESSKQSIEFASGPAIDRNQKSKIGSMKPHLEHGGSLRHSVSNAVDSIDIIVISGPGCNLDALALQRYGFIWSVAVE